MVNTVSPVRNNTTSTRRFVRPDTPASVLTDAAKSNRPLHGAQLFKKTGDESRERFFQAQEGAAEAIVDGDGQPEGNSSVQMQSLRARFANAAANPKQFRTLLKQALGENHKTEATETIRQQSLAGDFSWMSNFNEGDIIGHLLSGENIDSEQLFEVPEKNGAPVNADSNDTEVENGFVSKQVIDAKKQIEKIAHAVNENVVHPIKRQTGRAGSWVKKNAAQPVKQQGERIAGWVNDKVTQPIKQQANRFAGWVKENVAQTINRQGQRFAGWVKESVVQPVKQQAQQLGNWVTKSVMQSVIQPVIQPVTSGAARLGGWVTENVLQPSANAGKAMLNKAASAFDTTVANPLKQGADLVSGYTETMKSAVQNGWSETKAVIKDIFPTTTPAGLGSEADAGVANTSAAK